MVGLVSSHEHGDQKEAFLLDHAKRILDFSSPEEGERKIQQVQQVLHCTRLEAMESLLMIRKGRPGEKNKLFPFALRHGTIQKTSWEGEEE